MQVINLKVFITSLLIWAVTAVAAQNIHYAKPNMNTKALQSLIDKGGRVVFAKGEYHTGQLELKSGVELHLEEGAIILGSTSPYMHLILLLQARELSMDKDLLWH